MDRDSGDSENQAPDDEPEEDIEVLDGLESILQMELRLFQIVLSLREEIRRLQRSGISRVLSAQETL